MRYAVVDDYGDNWQHGDVAYSNEELEEVLEWAENENFHSASIIKMDEDGRRELVA